MLIVIAVIDLRNMIIPDSILIFGACVAVLYILVLRSSLIDSIIGCGTGLALFLVIALLTGAMGGGDIKLMALLGFIFGIRGVLFITVLSFVTGAAVSALLMVLKIKDRKDMIPFGPFISSAALLYIFYGGRLIDFYLTLFD